MASSRERQIDMSFFRGRNGFTDPTRLLSNGNFTGQAREQINLRTDRDVLETILGDELYGSEISASKRIVGLSVWGDDLVTVNDTNALIYDGDDFFVFDNALTTDLPTSFLEFSDQLFMSNGTDDVRRCVKTNVATAIGISDTTITVDDASEFANGVGKVFIKGDEIDYIGVSAGTIVNKVFADSPYTATPAEKTINVDTSGGNFTLNLPTAVGIKDTVYIVHKTTSDSNTVTIDPNSTETIDNALTKVLSTQGSSAVIRSDGVNWVTTTLSFAGANILDNVTNITSTHEEDEIVVQTVLDPNIPKGRGLEEYLGKFFLSKVPSTEGLPQDKNNVYYSATSNPSKPNNFYLFNEDSTKPTTEVVADYTTNGFDTDISANATSAAFTITLITAVNNVGLRYRIEKIDNSSNAVTIDGNGAETIDGQTTVTLSNQSDFIYIESDGTNWISTSLDPTGSGVELYTQGGDTTALLNYSGYLLVSNQDRVEAIQGFDLSQFPPLPNRSTLDKESGAINEDCMVKMAGDVVYFTSDRRIKRLFQPDGQDGIRQLDGFDLPVLDVLESIDEDQSEATMFYNERTRLLYLSVKSRGSLKNNLRIVYSTDNQSWWIQDNMFCRKYTAIKGQLYYGHSITGRVIKDETGFTHDGVGSKTKYESFHVKTRERRQLWAHHYFDGLMTENTVITVKFYVNDNLARTVTITESDITQKSASNFAAIGDGTVGDTMWGSGKPPLREISSLKRFEKWISLGKKGKKYYYTIETNGVSQRYEMNTSVAYFIPESQASRLQSTS